jgi:SAM-dependent methyltransferase
VSASISRRTCAFCAGGALEEVLNLGDVALAGGFVKPDQFASESRFPLRLHFCRTCCALQVLEVVDPRLLFANYFYFSSAIASLREHFSDYAAEVVARFLNPERAMAVEIGCNDGVLLKPLVDHGVRTVVGVDPATNIVNHINDDRITVVNSFFSRETARRIRDAHGAADLVTANNVYAHIPEINDVTQGVSELLGPDGVFVFEVHYLGSVVRGLQYDMIYHEHLYYYSLLALEAHLARHGLVVFDLKRIPIHGGSIRYYACKSSGRHARSVTNRVRLLRQEELVLGYNRVETFERFAREIALRKDSLMILLERLRQAGRTVAGYGASGRANTIIQYCGITGKHVQYMIDDARLSSRDPVPRGALRCGPRLPHCVRVGISQRDRGKKQGIPRYRRNTYHAAPRGASDLASHGADPDMIQRQSPPIEAISSTEQGAS